MELNRMEKEILAEKAKKLEEKVFHARKEHPEIECGATGSPEPFPFGEDLPDRQPVALNWLDLIRPEYDELCGYIRELLAQSGPVDTSGFPKLGDDNLWLWGGPTPSWGGSLAPDTLVRAARYFDIRNGVYVYGETTEAQLKLHSGFRRLLCQINSNCRTPGAMGEMSEEENAELLSRLSLKYPNIAGAMCDDVSAGFQGKIDPEGFIRRYHALKKHNPALRMYGVVYAHELKEKNFEEVAPWLDVVNLWFWNMTEIPEYDSYIELFRKRFPGKTILQGIFLHEYGISDAGNPPELLCRQLDCARKYMAEGLVEGVVLLGDREIPKWPATASGVRDYLKNQK